MAAEISRAMSELSVDLQASIWLDSDKLQGFFGSIAKIFCGFDEGIAGLLEESEDGEGKVRQRGKDLAEAGSTQIMPIFVPPTVLDEVQ